MNVFFTLKNKIFSQVYIQILFARAGEPELGVFGSLEPEPLKKKTRAVTRAAKKLVGSSALLEDKKHK